MERRSFLKRLFGGFLGAVAASFSSVAASSPRTSSPQTPQPIASTSKDALRRNIPTTEETDWGADVRPWMHLDEETVAKLQEIAASYRTFGISEESYELWKTAPRVVHQVDLEPHHIVSATEVSEPVVIRCDYGPIKVPPHFWNGTPEDER